MKAVKRHSVLSRTILLMMVCLMLLTAISVDNADTTPLPSQGPKRMVKLDVPYTIYEWWLLSWKTSQVLCQVYVEHESWPDPKEVLYYCGTSIQQQWLNTKGCTYNDQINSPQDCNGLYLHLSSVTPAMRQVEINLPPVEVFVSVVGCDKNPINNQCTKLPYLRFEAVEPLPNEQIIQILGTVNGAPFTCPGGICDLPLQPTGLAGMRITFLAQSSYGDSSEEYEAQVRIIPWGDFANPDSHAPDSPTYYVDVLSSQWKGEAISSCSGIWQAFQPVEGVPAWLKTPDLESELVSKNKLYYLAGSLIKQGIVDASTCPDFGLQTNGAATECGMTIARPVVESWQNQFNAEIIRVAKDTGIPAQMMKNIFSKESQFWPGIYDRVREAGLGHLSEMGADTVLLWNPAFYDQFCPLVLSEQTCQRGFGNLDKQYKDMLRGALVQKVNASCPNCPVKVDLTQATFSISIFARSMLANCEQVGQIIYNSTSKKAGQSASYEDLWKFTVLNYNAGSGCFTNALQRTVANRQLINWQNVSENLEQNCKIGKAYVNDVVSMPEDPTLISTSTPDLMPQATPTAQWQHVTPQPTATPVPTQNPGIYPP